VGAQASGAHALVLCGVQPREAHLLGALEAEMGTQLKAERWLKEDKEKGHEVRDTHSHL
jgi:hypothetical protein